MAQWDKIDLNKNISLVFTTFVYDFIYLKERVQGGVGTGEGEAGSMLNKCNSRLHPRTLGSGPEQKTDA